MRKKVIALLFAAALITSIAGAQSPRWSYVSAIGHGMEMTEEGLFWGADVTAYPMSEVTDTKITAKLQVQGGPGWATITTLSDKEVGILAEVHGTYEDWLPNHSYRVQAYAYIYNGDTLIETAGPVYSYYNT